PGAVRQIICEDLALVGRNQNVIAWRFLGEDRYLLLNLHNAAIGASSTSGVLEFPLLNDFGAETVRRSDQRRCEKLVALVRTNDKKPAHPLFPYEVLRQTVSQHRSGRRGMNDISPAILLPKTVIGRGGIEKQYALRFAGLSGLKQVVGGKIGHNQRDTLSCEFSYGRFGVIPGLQMQVDQGIALIEKSAGCVVVLGRHLRTRKSAIGRGHLDKGDCFLVLRAPQITDLDVESVLSAGREIKTNHDDQGERCKPDQDGAPG